MITHFWEKNRALLFGLVLFLGCLFALQTPWALLCCPFLIPKKYVFHASFLFLLPCSLVYHVYTFPPTGSEVEGIFYIHSIRKSDRFGQGWTYQGILKTEEGRLLCRSFSKSYLAPSAAYRVKGRVNALHGRLYALKTTEPWKFEKSLYNLVGIRLAAQEYVKSYIKKHISQKRAAHFLTGMITGQLEDRILRGEFGELGLSHLMAISGFHFALLALTFHLVLRLFLPPKPEALCLMILLTAYFLFIGSTPSILRAWTVAMIFLLGQLLEKRGTALNSLGVALCLSILWSPLSTLTLSFQLSFLATAGILFFYPFCNRMLSLWLPKRSLKVVIEKRWFWQQGYILISFLREALALTLAVHLTVFPLLIALFHTAPLNGLLYNLFFPFLASLALMFFLVSLVLGHWAHVLNGYYCEWILQLVESPPLTLKTYYVPGMPSWLLATLLTTLLALAISLQIKKRADGFSVTDNPFLDHL